MNKFGWLWLVMMGIIILKWLVLWLYVWKQILLSTILRFFFFFVECSYFRTFWHSYENLIIFCYFTKYNYTPRKQSDLSDAENCLFIFWLEANSILSSQLLDWINNLLLVQCNQSSSSTISVLGRKLIELIDLSF